MGTRKYRHNPHLYAERPSQPLPLASGQSQAGHSLTPLLALGWSWLWIRLPHLSIDHLAITQRMYLLGAPLVLEWCCWELDELSIVRVNTPLQETPKGIEKSGCGPSGMRMQVES